MESTAEEAQAVAAAPADAEPIESPFADMIKAANKERARVKDFKFRAWDVTDAQLYKEQMDNENIWKYMDGYPGPMTVKMAVDMIELANNSDAHEVRAVEYQGKVIGQVRLMFDKDVETCAELSYLIFAPYWGKGLAVPMIHAYRCDFAVRLPYRTMTAVIDKRNEASIAVAKKAGFWRMDLPVLRRESFGELLIFQALIK